jgi:pyruvate dehydrogenase E2 component (dihydrolipoamide acetyltransferase)
VSKQTVKVPDLGGASEVEAIEICVAVGDAVTEEQSLIVVESDKASMDIPSPFAGVVTSISVAEGATVSEGDVILELEIEGANSEAVETEATDTGATNAEVSNTGSDNTAVAVEESSVEPEAAAPAAEPAAATVQTVVVPDLGGADAVELIEVLVGPGDIINEGDGIVVMESDKASMELPSPVTGVIVSLHINEGDSLSEGDPVAEVEVQAQVQVQVQAQAQAPEQPAAAPAAAREEKPAAKPAPAAPAPAAANSSNANAAGDRRRKTDVYAGPAVRKLARELGVDLSRVTGTGPRGRLAKEDLHAFVKKAVNEPQGVGGAIPAVPEVDFSQFGEVDIQPMSKLHKGIKITPLPFLMKAVAAALRANPAFNASLGSDGESIVYKNYVHVGMAVDTPAGLMVPVIRDVDSKGIWDLSVEILELATKAKERKLKPNEMQGGCFTISSLGGIGGTGFTPIVNTPEVGILGVSKLQIKPVYVGDQLEPRKMLPLSLSYDHRAVNGGDAGRFFTFLSAVLADVRRLVL